MNLLHSDGQGIRQLAELGIAFFLSAAIGLEREIKHKSAGLRTYTVVGTAAALFLLISKYGFMDVLRDGLIVVDPSRVAAQIVTGTGFLGAGLIFTKGDNANGVKGVTTAATIWLVTAIGMACGAGLVTLAAATTIAYFVIAIGFPPLIHLLTGKSVPAELSKTSEHD